MQRFSTMPPRAAIPASPPFSFPSPFSPPPPPPPPTTGFISTASPCHTRGVVFAACLHLQGAPLGKQQLQLVHPLRGVLHKPPPPSLPHLPLLWPVQRSQPTFPPPASRRQVPSGEALHQAAEVAADGAAVSRHDEGRRRISAQPAAAYEGKQGDQCWDHRGDSSQRTCLNTHTFNSTFYSQPHIYTHTHTHTH